MKPTKYSELRGIFYPLIPWAAIVGGLASLADFGLGMYCFGLVMGYFSIIPLIKWYGRWFR